MSRGFAIWLDVLRVFAALAVLVGHWAHIKFTRGDYYFFREWTIGPDAVVVFFVLSGLVIAFTAERDDDLGQFAFNRLSRLLSVVFPAILLTMAFDAWGQYLRADLYYEPFYEPISLWQALLRGLSFTNEWRAVFDRVRIGSNGALWSLSFEAVYYALFAVCFFLRGYMRILVALVIVAAVGLPILVLLPTWVIGVVVWRKIASPNFTMPNQAALRLAVLPVVLFLLFKIYGISTILMQLSIRLAGENINQMLAPYAQFFLWNWVLSALVAAHLLGVSTLLKGRQTIAPEVAVRAIRWLAGASFSIYVCHYPTLHLLDAMLPLEAVGRDAWLLVGAVAVALVFAMLFERPVSTIRGWLAPVWDRLFAAGASKYGATRQRGGP